MITYLSPTRAVAMVFRSMLCSPSSETASRRFLLDPVIDGSNHVVILCILRKPYKTLPQYRLLALRPDFVMSGHSATGIAGKK